MKKHLEAAAAMNVAVFFGTTMLFSQLPHWSYVLGAALYIGLLVYSWKHGQFTWPSTHAAWFIAWMLILFLTVCGFDLFSQISIEIILDQKINWRQVGWVIAFWGGTTILTAWFFSWVTKKRIIDNPEIIDMGWIWENDSS